MKTYRLFLVGLAVSLLVVAPACGGGGVAGGDDDDTVDAGGNDVDSGGDGQWQTLISRPWSIAGGTEQYRCATVTVDEDMFVAGFRALAPNGTHHTVVTIQSPDSADAEFDCEPGTLSDQMVFASGVGTDDLLFPPGVAVKIPAGSQILLNLHLFNLGDAELPGESGTEILTIPASEVQQEAEMVFGGTFQIFLPAGQETSASGSCQFSQDATVMTVWPHMHQLGTHMKVVHNAATGDVTIHDRSFDFNEQLNWPIDPGPIQVKAGETIRTTCTWNNTSNAAVTFGDSSTQEMCFSGLYRYPAANAGLFCTQGF